MVPRLVPDLPEGPLTHLVPPSGSRWVGGPSGEVWYESGDHWEGPPKRPRCSGGFPDLSRTSPKATRPVTDHRKRPPTHHVPPVVYRPVPNLWEGPPTRSRPPRECPNPSLTSPRVPLPVLNLPVGPYTPP